ncbi:FAD-dependent oxidoreductase [Campylobacter sp. VTCC 70190]|uniref:glycerol-3-phosphate dehydrogenase/oxidase n=1 Tax=Campylobacter sp. VTCC 70190 TaxID=3392118 RepID=UPI00398E6742
MRKELENLDSHYDCIIIGGGASGLGIAFDCATRGYKTLLVEAKDFAKGTSSRSTKLLHGGVRYLAQGDFALVYEALHERQLLIQNAPHLCKKQAFIIPSENFFSTLYYTLGLKIYALMAGKMSLGKTTMLNKICLSQRLQGIKEKFLHSGVVYFDGQFDDARLALSLARSAEFHGACVLNYMKVSSLLKNEKGELSGVALEDKHPNASLRAKKSFEVRAKCIFNATGVFTNELNKMNDNTDSSLDIVPSQGIHLVLDRSFLPTDDALMIPKTADKRVLFAIPWHNKLLVGTTDTLIEKVSYEPKALDEEIDFVLNTFANYAIKKPSRKDVLSVFAGLRPLAAFKDKNQATKSISRTHKISVSKSKLISLNGGKWTTFRAMAEECIDEAIKHQLLEPKPCRTKDTRLFGYAEGLDFNERLSVYGSELKELKELEKNPEFAKTIHPHYAYTLAQVKWAISYEKALCLEDVLARRMRLLFLDAKAALQAAPSVASFMAKELGWSQDFLEQELANFTELAKSYQLH